MDNAFILIAALAFVCGLFAIGAWIAELIASKQNEPQKIFLPDNPVLFEKREAFNPLLRAALDAEHKAQQDAKREHNRARQSQIITRLQYFYAVRPRPWLSPNARARKLRHG